MEWWEEFFDADYVDAWSAMGMFDATDDQVAALVDLLALPPGSALLDAACGFGRIAGPLHERGFQVTGIDTSPAQLALAAQRHAGPRYVRADMRRPPAGPYDGVVNFFSSFGYFADAREDRAALQAWRGVLRDGGVLVMELIHRDRLAYLEGKGEPPAQEKGTTDWVSGVRTATVTHGQVAKTFQVRLYTVTQLIEALRDVGFCEVEAFGGLRRAPVSPATRLTIRAVA